MTCHGGCCARFDVAVGNKWVTLPELRARLEAGERVQDGEYIAAMLIPLEDWDPEGDEPPKFTCLHWDPGTGLCTEYEARPQMCRDYGTEAKRCVHGCGGGCG